MRMALSLVWVKTLTAGVLLSTIPIRPGSGTYTSMIMMWAGTTTIRRQVFMFAV
jgi:hypothetical protein